MDRNRLLSILLVFGLLSTLLMTLNVSAQDTDATPTTEVPRSAYLRGDLEAAQAAWAALDIDTYTLTMRSISVWLFYNATVQWIGGQPVYFAVRCEPGPATGSRSCNVPNFHASDFSVEWLFEQALLAVGYSDGYYAQISLHPEYHFPTSITFRDPNLLDADFFVEVSGFATDQQTALRQDGGRVVTAIPAAELATATQRALDRAATQTAIANLESTVTPRPTLPTGTPFSTHTPSPPPVQPPFDDNLMAWIDEAEAQWEAQNITQYDMLLQESTAWTGAEFIVWVRDGRVYRIDASCRPGGMGGPCWLRNFDATEFSVPGLFEKARTVAALPMPMSDPLEFDGTYHLPLRIFYDELDMVDEEWSLRVVRFTPRQ